MLFCILWDDCEKNKELEDYLDLKKQLEVFCLNQNIKCVNYKIKR